MGFLRLKMSELSSRLPPPPGISFKLFFSLLCAADVSNNRFKYSKFCSPSLSSFCVENYNTPLIFPYASPPFLFPRPSWCNSTILYLGCERCGEVVEFHQKSLPKHPAEFWFFAGGRGRNSSKISAPFRVCPCSLRLRHHLEP